MGKNDLSICDKYFEHQRTYEKKFGKMTVVLYQVGSFYEIYEFDPSKCGVESDKGLDGIGHAIDLSFILNIILTRRRKDKPYSYKNPNMIGFPCIAYEKHKEKILANFYTIVRMDQINVTTNGQSSIERDVVEILSSVTDIKTIDNLPQSNIIFCIYLEWQKKQQSYDNILVSAGLSMIDVSTGKNYIGEFHSNILNPIGVLQNIYRCLIANNPSEILLYVNDIDEKEIDNYKKFLYKFLELERYGKIILKFNECDDNYHLVDYQLQFFNKMFMSTATNRVKGNNETLGETLDKTLGKIKFDHRQHLHIFEELNIETFQYGRISYIILMQYCYNFNELILQGINRPDINLFNINNYCLLTDNAILQLDLFPRYIPKFLLNAKHKSKMDSLYTCINSCLTALGKRYLKQQLVMPHIEEVELNKMYSQIEVFMINEAFRNDLESRLTKFPDIERYQRKLIRLLIQPHELVLLFQSYAKIVDMYKKIKTFNNPILNDLLFDQSIVDQFNQVISLVYGDFDLDKLELCQINNELFEFPACPLKAKSKCTSILTDFNRQKEISDCLINVCTILNDYLPKGDWIKFQEIPDMNGYFGIMCTQAKGDLLKKQFLALTNKKDILHCKRQNNEIETLDNEFCRQLTFEVQKKKMLIRSPLINQLCDEYHQLRGKLRQDLYEMYKNLIEKLGQNLILYEKLDNFVSRLDFVLNGARVALKYRHFRPIIETSKSGSFCQFTELRHPFAEHIIESEYVTNDLTLGQEPCGLIIYGMNSAGKSTLTKAVGLNIILAQIGYYTAGHLKFRPYTRIITRLSGHDDILKGHSSFIVEMTELRTILREANSTTLVLGDELCRGTEISSGSALTIATILELIKRQSSFIFSTHLHHLPQTKYLSAFIPSILRICHLSTTYDRATQTLIYNRKLEDGQGSSIYGIEVARALYLDPEFIEIANDIRKTLTGATVSFLNTKKSHFNSKLYIDTCAICGKSSNKDLQTHHLKEQSQADDKGFIQTFHKNRSFNLIVVCQDCHQNIHHTNQSISTVQTLTGTIYNISPDPLSSINST